MAARVLHISAFIGVCHHPLSCCLHRALDFWHCHSYILVVYTSVFGVYMCTCIVYTIQLDFVLSHLFSITSPLSHCTKVLLISQYLLLQTTPPAALVRLHSSKLRDQHNQLNRIYQSQHRASIEDFLNYHMLQEHHTRGGLLLQVCVYSHYIIF